jgi:hypothetical protein
MKIKSMNLGLESLFNQFAELVVGGHDSPRYEVLQACLEHTMSNAPCDTYSAGA